MTQIDPTQPTSGASNLGNMPSQPEPTADLTSLTTPLSSMSAPEIPAPASNYTTVEQSLMQRLHATKSIDAEKLVELVSDELVSYLIKVQSNSVPFENDVLYEATAVFLRKFMEEKQKMSKQKAYELFEQFWTDTIKKNILKLKHDEKTQDAFQTSQEFMKTFGKRMQAISEKMLEDANEEALNEQNMLNEMGSISNGMLGYVEG